MEKTAIRQLIEKLEDHRNAINETESEANRARFGAYSIVIIEAKELEPVNEQQIKDAYKEGHYHLEYDTFDPDNYFNQTFEK